ncbi:uncharacterized protein PAC_08602 [Phialocephala subalpina]|uniref:Hsp70 protein n=1 Tax=Phialocephala subalpina TaxID=576137 RepID=A0A1L7X125_9HELO|nr:uncharacterized protein PAC_08602 [Phialocephala subalpina]
MAQNNNAQPAVGVEATGATGPRILLGLDYGYSFTSLAYCQTCGLAIEPDEFDSVVFREWPEVSMQRVPSKISYSPTNPDTHCSQWGWSIDKGSRVLEYTKLELEPRSTLEELVNLRDSLKGLDLLRELRVNDEIAISNDVPIHITKSAEDVVMDYLSKVTRAWWQHMFSQGRYTLECVPLDLVITYPDRWSYETMNKFYRAVRGAFPDAMFPTLRNISFVSEFESWILYTVQDMYLKVPRHNFFIPGECIVVCYVESGRVELASYLIGKLEPFEISKVGMHSVGNYGQASIETSFLTFLEPRIQNLDQQEMGTRVGWNFLPRTQVILERFERIQHIYTGTGDALLTIPRGTRIAPGFEDSFVNGVLTLTEEDLKGIYSGTLNKILRLLAQQTTRVRSMNLNGFRREVTNIIMAGGLSESEYLFNEVTKFAHRSGNCQVHRPDDCWDEGVLPDQVTWLVRRGDVILPDQAILSTFNIRYKFPPTQQRVQRRKQITFIATSNEEPNSSLMEILPIGPLAPELRENIEVAYLSIDLRSIPDELRQRQEDENGGFYYTVDLEVELTVSSEVSVKVKHMEQILRSFGTVL